ncbi:MAG: hypothetical protein AAF291_02125 [Pseudomonadota bacterium]
MSNHLISATYKRSLGSGTRKAMMVLMADKASDDGRGIYASKQTMADELDLSKQTVINTIKGLIGDGLLFEIGQRRCDTGHTVEYAINVDALSAMPPVGYEQKRAEKAESRKRPSPVKEVDRSTSATPTGQAALPKPLSKPFTPQSPQGAEGESRDIGDRTWGGMPGRTWNDGGKPKPKRRHRNRKSENANEAKPDVPVKAKASECEQSAALHDALLRALGEARYRQWLSNSALLGEGNCLTVIAPSENTKWWIERFGMENLASAGNQVLGRAFDHISVVVEAHG